MNWNRDGFLLAAGNCAVRVGCWVTGGAIVLASATAWAGEVDAAAQEVPLAGTTPKPKVFSKKVTDCVEEANKATRPMRECYNLYLGRDPDAHWFEEVYQAVAKDRYNYGPFVRSPLEHVTRGRWK